MALFDFVKKKKEKKEKDKTEKVEAKKELVKEVSTPVKRDVGAKVDKLVAKEEVKPEKKKEKVILSKGKVAKENAPAKAASGARKYAFILKNPRITEKATMLSVQSIYTFDVFPRATKLEVKKAIEELYNVTPVKIRIINIPSKTVFVRRQRGTKSRGKKAMVYLREGETIEFV